MTTLTDEELLAWLECQTLKSDEAGQYAFAIGMRLRELLAQQEWQPISSAPKQGAILAYLCNPSNDRCVTVIQKRLTGWDWCPPYFTPTHWRPLPAPPKDG